MVVGVPMKILFNFFLISVLFTTNALFAQGKKYEGPDDPAGDIAAEREGWMSGNRVLLYFQNNTELANWPNNDQSKWPNDHTGTGMHDGIGLFLGAKVYLRNDTEPVTDPNEIKNSTNLDTLYYCETSYRHGMDRNEEGTLEWGLYPVFGYFSENSEYPAMSNRPGSWPTEGWPSNGVEFKWPGEWDGRFGRGIHYADLETYFVANDAQDQEYLGEDDTLKYAPRPGVFIGDKLPSVTVQKGMPWGGLGLRVKVRGYQWNNPQTRDAIFWEYDISNISDYDLNDVAFGYWLDNGIGHRGNVGEADDIGFFDKYENISYSWDVDGVGVGGMRTGITGIAFLESPGIPWDNVDNDDDGLVDEQRDNHATVLVGPYDGIADLNKFLSWYGLSEKHLKEHWDADEDQDWDDGFDADGNGTYEIEEDYGDDVGTDGVGPKDLNYNGPDEDGSECNHKPDFTEGLGSEPDFGPLDVSESDMLGLTAFTLFHHPQPTEPPMSQFDKEAYGTIATPGLVEFFGELSNLIEMFGSGPFPLPHGRTERISLSEVHSYEELSGLNADIHTAPAMFEKKRIVQFIYDSDYRFAQPPSMPTLKATAGDGKVFLTWDDVADVLTHEPMLRGENDFEGYKLYRASDKYFSDAEQLRDMYGNPIGKKPIFQCDLDNGKRGAADFVDINGELFYLGEDTGIQHYFIDNDVQNGRTYYYALTAYDYGIDGLEVAIMPAENNIVIDLDEAENIRFVGKNVQVITPRQKAAGYIPPEIELFDNPDLMGAGTIIPTIFDYELMKQGHTYQITFDVDTVGFRQNLKQYHHFTDLFYINNGYSVYDATADSVVYRENPQKFLYDNITKVVILLEDFWAINPNIELLTEVFDGIQLNISTGFTEAYFDTLNSGWIVGDTQINVSLTDYTARYFPWQYDIVFTSQDSAYRTRTNRAKKLKSAAGDNLKSGDVLLDQSFNFYVINKSFRDSTGEYVKMDMIVHDINDNDQFDITEDVIIVGPTVPKEGSDYIYWGSTIFSIDFRDSTSQDITLPNPNDVYRLNFIRPFTETDTITFKVKPEIKVNASDLKSEMDKISVVPNPYVATNMMETALSNPMLNQRRKLLFTNIPAQCEIKIFSSSGIFIDGITVDNPSPTGIIHCDMLTHEDLEIAAGIYVYHIKSEATGKEKVGKFAVIK